MSTRNEILSTTLDASGGTATSNPVNLSNDEGLTIQFEGDENSPEVKITTRMVEDW